MEQTKALNALEPFLALSKSATSSRAAADLITRATSAPSTFVFAELLQTPNIQNLADAVSSAPEHAAHLDLLKIFAYGTYQEYQATPGLPTLNDRQIRKLRQLSILTLARDRSNLSYDALQKHLELTSSQELEELVISAIYAGLLTGTLDPSRQVVQVVSLSPLRDLMPGAIPQLNSALKSWNARCTSTLGDIDKQIREIREGAASREREKLLAEKKKQKSMSKMRGDDDKKYDHQHQLLPGHRRVANKRGKGDGDRYRHHHYGQGSELMDVDDPPRREEKKLKSKRRL